MRKDKEDTDCDFYIGEYCDCCINDYKKSYCFIMPKFSTPYCKKGVWL